MLAGCPLHCSKNKGEAATYLIALNIMHFILYVPCSFYSQVSSHAAPSRELEGEEMNTDTERTLKSQVLWEHQACLKEWHKNGGRGKNSS